MANKPKYLVVADAIARKIRSGKFAAGETIPSENGIAKLWNVSGATSRKAHLELEMRGLVKRVKGKGTVVLDGKNFMLTRVLGSPTAIRGNFAENLKRDGIKPENKTVETRTFKGRVSVQIGGNFHEIVGTITSIRTLRYGNGMLLKDETVFLAAAPEEASEFGASGSLPALLSSCGFDVEKVERNISAQPLPATDNRFDKSTTAAVLFLEGACISKSNKVVAIEKSLYNGSLYKFTVSTSL